jgi:uncharacterized protein YdaL
MTDHKNIGNTYATKAAESVKAAHIHIRCTKAEKARIVRVLNDKEKLSDFIMQKVLEEVNKREVLAGLRDLNNKGR